MTLRLPNAEELSRAEAEARAKHGTDKLVRIDYAPPIGDAVGLHVVRFTLRTYKAFVDLQLAHGIASSHASVFMDHVVFPPQDERSALKLKWAALPKKVAAKLLALAGQDDAPPIMTPLEVGKEPTWLPADRAAEIIAEAEENETVAWTVQKGRLRLVMLAAESDVYIASQEAQRRALEKKSGVVDATIGYARDLVRFEAEPLDLLLEELPGLVYSTLDKALDVMAGEVAELETRSFP